MRRVAHRQMEEDPDIDDCFAYFRRKHSGVDVQWVKEQVYRTSCVPEKCPATRSLVEIFLGLGLGLGLGGPCGEAVVKNEVGFRFD
ncbi:unnamed protein product [Ectocarpus sp. 8 AP-2014]